MNKKILPTFSWILGILVLPLLGKPELLLSWQVVTAIVAAALLNFTQPILSVKDVVHQDWRDRGSVVVLIITGSLFFMIPAIDFAYGRLSRDAIGDPWSIAGLALTFGGLAFRIWSIRTLGQFFTPLVVIQDNHRVIRKGPYKYLRHPSYAGALVLAFGISTLFHSFFGLAFCAFGFFPSYIYRMHVEEEALRKELGQAYLEHVQNTWRIIPFVY